MTLRGTVTTAHWGQRVQVQQRVSGRWRTVKTAVTSRSGSYAASLSWTSKGVKTYRVVKPADVDHAVGVSPVRSVTVR